MIIKRTRPWWRKALRRVWLVALTAALGFAGAYVVGAHKTPKYSSSAYVVVSAGSTIQASEADQLALTYAGLIPNDSAIASYVSTMVGSSVATVRSSLSVAVENSTAILRLTYKASSRDTAIAGSRALAQALTRATPVSKAVPPRSVVLVSLPTTATESGVEGATVLGLGAVAGLILGLFLAVVWEKLDPRVDGLADLGRLLDCPVTDEGQSFGKAAPSLVERWTAAKGPEAVVALVSADSSGAASLRAWKILRSLPGAQDRSKINKGVVKRSPSNSAKFMVFGAPGGPQVGEAGALHSDTVVLVAIRGQSLAEVDKSARLLSEFGHRPDWGVLLSSSGHSHDLLAALGLRSRLPRTEKPALRGSSQR